MDLQGRTVAHYCRIPRFAYLLLLLGVTALSAPVMLAAGPDGALTVRVVTLHGAQLPPGTRVTISGKTTKTLSLDAYGVAEFLMVPPGFYQVSVTMGGSEVGQGTVEVESGRGNTTMVELHLAGARAATGTVSASALAVPRKAAKELRRANDALAKDDLQGAQEHCEKALAIYPASADAHNVMGVIAVKQGSRQDARAHFLKALEIDPAHAEANANVARIALFEQQWADAEGYAQLSLKTDPSSASTLLLLTVAQFKLRKFDEAIASARRVHELAPLQNPVGHLIAATCLRLESRNFEAIAEYKTYLREAPTASNAGEVRKKLRALEHPQVATAK